MGYRKQAWWDKTLVEVLFASVFLILKSLQLIGEITVGIFKGALNLIVFVFFNIFRLIVKLAEIPTNLTYNLVSSLSKWRLPKLRQISWPRFRLARGKRKKTQRNKPFKGKMSRLRIFKIFVFGFLTAFTVLVVPLSITFVLKELPNPKSLTLRSVPVTTKIFDRNGMLLYEIYADQNRTPVTLDDIPVKLRQATIAIEDQDFYKHDGFSFKGILRAVVSIYFNNEIQGGSTITQQLIRSALLTPEVSLTRKVKELILSVWAEHIYTKDEILEMYFNQVPYGGTAWGIESAAQTYFGKKVQDLTLAEAAVLAGLPAAPSIFSPFGSQPELALEREKEVLRRMQEEGYISEAEKRAAEQEEIVFQRPRVGLRAPHFVMYVRDLLAKKYGIRMVEQGGLRVVTSLDLNLNNQVQEIVSAQVLKLEKLRVGNGAALVTDPKNGEILAMVGSTDYFDLQHDGNVNVALTLQQPGSAIKVVNYAAALENGFTAASLLDDNPKTYNIAGSLPYSPVNYDDKYHGLVPLRYALGNSFNVAAVTTLEKVGVEKMIEKGRAMGIDSWTEPDRYGLSLTLGGAEVTMLDMAEVYGTLANQGVHLDLKPIIQISDYQGTVLEDNHKLLGERRALSKEIAFIISDILADNAARAISFGTNSLLRVPDNWVAVKTGTSNDKRDNWAIGYTTDFVVVSWVGNNDNSPMHPTLASGITGATPIWRGIVDLLLKDKPSLAPAIPEGVKQLPCRGRNEFFVIGTESEGSCRPIPTPTTTVTPESN